jgi:hypothetical protein
LVQCRIPKKYEQWLEQKQQDSTRVNEEYARDAKYAAQQEQQQRVRGFEVTANNMMRTTRGRRGRRERRGRRGVRKCELQ